MHLVSVNNYAKFIEQLIQKQQTTVALYHWSNSLQCKVIITVVGCGL